VLVTTGGLSGRAHASGCLAASYRDDGRLSSQGANGRFAVISVNSLEEAIEWAKRFRTIVGDGESELFRCSAGGFWSGLMATDVRCRSRASRSMGPGLALGGERSP